MKRYLICLIMVLLGCIVLLNGPAAHGAEAALVSVVDGTGTVSGAYTLAEAMNRLGEGTYLKLMGDVHEETEVSGTVYLDMNGHDLSGVTVTGTLYGFDSATDAYTGDKAGTLTCTLDGGQVVSHHKMTGSDKRYLTVPGDSNTYSFHRFYLGITKLSLKPATAGMGYKAAFAGDEAVKNYLSGPQAYGYQLWLDGGSKVTRGYSADKFGGLQELTLRVNNILSLDNAPQANQENAWTKIHAAAFIRLKDGSTITGTEYSHNFREMLQLADGAYSEYTQPQQTALQKISASFSECFMTWDIPNTHHAQGGIWEEVTASQFIGKLTKKNGNYHIAPGSYVLTEDTDIGSRSLFVPAGQQVRLCLNGHSLSGTARIFRLYGQLDLCDCHGDAEEGTVISSLAGETATYAPAVYVYSGTLNLYGGHLKATGQVTSAGVAAVGHGTVDGTVRKGTFNMYGGSLSGGNSISGAGLLAVWDSSTFNMYGGRLYGGYTAGNGGAGTVGGSSEVNIYGGQIYGNTADGNGGGFYCNGSVSPYLGGDVSIYDNTAGGKGGNIAFYSTGDLVMNGASLTGSSAAEAGGVYASKGAVTLSGQTRILDNVGGNLWQCAGVRLDMDGLTQGAEVHLYNMSSTALGTDASALEYVTLESTGYKTANIAGKLVLLREDFAIPAQAEGFQVGFGRADITPTEVGVPLAGYGNATQRLSKDMGANEYDKLKVSTVAITDENGQTVLIISADLIRPSAALISTILPVVSAVTGVPEGNIITNFTHTHSVPETNSTGNAAIQRYNAMLPDRFAESASLAMADRAAATMEMGSFEVDGLNFTRHYQYTDGDGIVQYFGDNFGTQVLNDTTQHVTEADRTMHLVKFTRDGEDILMANWRVHPHMTGGSSKYVVSADIIGTTRKYFEEKSGMHFLYLQGAAGNINEVSKLNEEKHGYNYVQYGDALSNQMLAALEAGCLSPAATGQLQVDNFSYTALADHPSEEEYNAAKAAKAAYEEWLAANPSATSAQKRAFCESYGYLTHFHFNNVITRYGLQDTYQLPLNVISLGDELAFFTAPGELWDTVSMEVEAASPFAMTMCVGYSQDHYNYFVYDPTNGGEMTYESYEGNNYRFVAPDTINGMIAYWKQALNELYSNLEK